MSRRDGHDEIFGCYRKRHPVFLDEAYRDGGSFFRVSVFDGYLFFIRQRHVPKKAVYIIINILKEKLK